MRCPRCQAETESGARFCEDWGARLEVALPELRRARHAGLGLLTPADVHPGLAEQRAAARAIVLAAAYAAHPERFPVGLPHPAA